MRLEMLALTAVFGMFALVGAIESNENPIPALILVMVTLILIWKEVTRNAKSNKKRREADKPMLDFDDYLRAQRDDLSGRG